MNRALLVALTVFALLPAVAHAQATAPGCGDTKIKFDVQTSKAGASVIPSPGQALVYFIQNDVNFQTTPSLTTRFAIDGQWVGADRGRSYFAVSLAPGEHEICSSWQNRSVSRWPRAAATHLTAEAGKTYFIEVRNTFEPSPDAPVAVNRIDVTLSPIDPNEAKILISASKQSISHPKS